MNLQKTVVDKNAPEGFSINNSNIGDSEVMQVSIHWDTWIQS